MKWRNNCVIAQSPRCVHTNEKNKVNESCWMDFAFLHGRNGASLEQFFANEYSSLTGNMHFGPYRVYGVTDTNATKDIERITSTVGLHNTI